MQIVYEDENKKDSHGSLSLLFPKSVPLTPYFYNHSNYNDVRRSKIMMFGDSFSKYKTFANQDLNAKNTMLKYLERGCYNLTRKKSHKNGFVVSWDDDNFSYMYHDICYKVVMNVDPESVVGSTYLTEMILAGGVLAGKVAEMSSQEMCPEKYVEILNRVRLMNEDIKIKTSKLYTCPKCKHQETVLSQVQDRANDENASLIAVCVYCSYRWRMAG